MASANVKTITDQNFSAEVLQSELPTLIDFWAVWCGPWVCSVSRSSGASASRARR